MLKEALEDKNVANILMQIQKKNDFGENEEISVCFYRENMQILVKV